MMFLSKHGWPHSVPMRLIPTKGLMMQSFNLALIYNLHLLVMSSNSVSPVIIIIASWFQQSAVSFKLFQRSRLEALNLLNLPLHPNNKISVKSNRSDGLHVHATIDMKSLILVFIITFIFIQFFLCINNRTASGCFCLFWSISKNQDRKKVSIIDGLLAGFRGQETRP